MANWRLSVTGGSSIDLNNSFNLRDYHRRTSFTEQTLDGQDGAFVDNESLRESTRNMILRGFIQEGTAAASETKLEEIETVMDSRETNLNLIYIPTSTSYHVVHVDTRAIRRGGGLLEVTITLRTKITIL